MWTASQATARTSRGHLTRRISTGALAAALALVSQASFADEGGVSFWLPGLFGSLAAVPQQPGWSLTSVYYHTSVSAGADVSRAREFQIGKIPVKSHRERERQTRTREPISGLPSQPTPSQLRSLAASLVWVPLEFTAALTPPWRGQ